MTPKPLPSPHRLLRLAPYLMLALALGWVGMARVPLIQNAASHLDSDLAVDGLTLIEALNGHWRWHYPATPFIGSPPVLLSWVQARVWGPSPAMLVSGGVVAYGLVVVASYWLNRRAFGPSVAAWGLVPLVFASTGLIWLAGRITGGHLLTAAWHAVAFAMAWGVLTRGRWWRSAGLGLWSGLGLYLDSMFAVTWLGIGSTVVLGWVFDRGKSASPPLPAEEPGKSETRHSSGSWVMLLAFALGAGVGLAPRIVGGRLDPHDAYALQFHPDFTPDHIASNARILLMDCLARLVAGHRLPGLQAEPSTTGDAITGVGLATTLLALGLFVGSVAALVAGPGGKASSTAGLAVRLGLVASSLAVVAGFLVYPSISNSDHYRYLVCLVIPWSSGFGLLMTRIASSRHGGPWTSGLVALGFASLMTADTARWYERLGWVDRAWRPVVKSADDPALAWLVEHPEVSAILGDYWDVHRLAFLTGGRVASVAFSAYPDRFPETRAALPGPGHRVIIIRPGEFGPIFRTRALAMGAREWKPAPGLSIVEWPEGMTP